MRNLKKEEYSKDPFFARKKGQVTIFIIVGIIIIAAIIGYFLLTGPALPGGSKELKQGEDAYLACISDRVKLGISLLGQQGGYIYLEELKFYPGSAYMPSSSQLDFYGNSVPYWMFVSGNNILVEQKPTKEKMTEDLTRFIYEGINSCNFNELNDGGIFVNVYDGKVDVAINSNSVDISLDNPIFITFDNDSATVTQHKVQVKSKLGKFYDLASAVYEKEKADGFLEEYGLDAMRLYAPVTGVEFTCAPKYFNEELIKNNITQALETNIAFLKLSGNYYELSDPKHSYFVVDVGQKVDENVNFVYSSSWPTKIQMFGDKLVQPVGNQQGLGMFGLCFVPYHFVYNINFPVLIQFYDGAELFQFGVVAIIKNSQSREAVLGGEELTLGDEICADADKKISISTYDLKLNPVEANLRFECLGESCELGKTKISSDGSILIADVPSCVNGVLQAYAENYTSSSQTISTNREDKADILMKKIREINVSIKSTAPVTILFSSEDYTSVFNYPEDKTVKLTEGEYNITAFVYQNTTLSFPGVKDRKCLDVPSSSIGGVFGATDNKCFDLDIPAQTIDSALVGGGKAFEYFAEDQLMDSQKLVISVPMFKVPTKIEDLQSNYLQWETSRVDLTFQ
ncbi:MAG: hypothetical protein WCI72_05915 [archaeon]